MQLRHTMMWAALALVAMVVSTATADRAEPGGRIRAMHSARGNGAAGTQTLADSDKGKGDRKRDRKRDRTAVGERKQDRKQDRDRQRDCAADCDRTQDRQRKRDRKRDCIQDCDRKQDRKRDRDRKRDCDTAVASPFNPEAFCKRSGDRDQTRGRDRDRDCGIRDRLKNRDDKRKQDRDC